MTAIRDRASISGAPSRTWRWSIPGGLATAKVLTDYCRPEAADPGRGFAPQLLRPGT